MFEYGFAQEDITPECGMPLCGYFNPRPNRGALDRLAVKAVVFHCGDEYSAIVSYDLCMVDNALATRMIKALSDAGITFGGKVLFAATHTHTGPYTCTCFSDFTNAGYLDDLVNKTVSAVKRATASLAPAELLATRTEYSTLAFNRRFIMTNGRILTNPGKLNPDIVRPEGTTDPEIPLLAIRQHGSLRLLIANIVNHTDTVGGDMVSADWPGRMEAKIQRELSCDIPVMTLIGAQGNINHFNVKTAADQTSYEEAIRIGNGYAAAVLSALYQLEPLNFEQMKADAVELEAPYMTVSDAEYEDAKRIAEKYKDAQMEDGRDFTSEDIAKGHPFVKKFFAKRLMDCRDKKISEKRVEKMLAIKFGDRIGIVSVPCEPFVEIGLAVKKASHFPLTLVAALGMGEIGYVGLPDNYGNGGYETSPSPSASDRNWGPTLIKTASDLLNRF
ncbi:MAG: hypothetical protein A2017_11810 [Lentisphaerae bacterium GWF2_44_16]|nr:MAG: hypothetical protein A2017_11810 [Lentisphaerae bacterium GWF2_44_16]